VALVIALGLSLAWRRRDCASASLWWSSLGDYRRRGIASAKNRDRGGLGNGARQWRGSHSLVMEKLNSALRKEVACGKDPRTPWTKQTKQY